MVTHMVTHIVSQTTVTHRTSTTKNEDLTFIKDFCPNFLMRPGGSGPCKKFGIFFEFVLVDDMNSFFWGGQRFLIDMLHSLRNHKTMIGSMIGTRSR